MQGKETTELSALITTSSPSLLGLGVISEGGAGKNLTARGGYGYKETVTSRQNRATVVGTQDSCESIHKIRNIKAEGRGGHEFPPQLRG